MCDLIVADEGRTGMGIADYAHAALSEVRRTENCHKATRNVDEN